MVWVPVDSKCCSLSPTIRPSTSLYLRFRSGDVYRYFDFPNETYQQFLLAESKGQFFLTNIRNCLRYERLAKLQVA
jgi:hypothetical protein